MCRVGLRWSPTVGMCQLLSWKRGSLSCSPHSSKVTSDEGNLANPGHSFTKSHLELTMQAVTRVQGRLSQQDLNSLCK